MSYRGFPKWLSPDRVDVSLAKIGLLLSVLLLGFRLLAAQVLLLVIPIAAGAGSALYLLARRNREPHAVAVGEGAFRELAPTLPRSVVGFLPAVVTFGLAGLVLAVHQIGARTVPIYLLTGAVGVAIFAQVLFADGELLHPGLVLGQILVAALVIRLTALYATPGYVGVDIWTHATVMVEGVARAGSLAPLAGDKYLMAPLYHVVGATGALAFGGARNGIYLTMGVLVPLSALFVYATGQILLSARWALLATALYAFSDQFIRWGLHIIPTSLGLVFFLAVVYAVTRIFDADAELWAVGLLLASSLAVVFTHQVSTAVVLVFLGTAALAAVTTAATRSGSAHADTRNAVAVAGVFAVTLATTVASWSVTPFSRGGSFLGGELAVLGEILAEDAGFLNLASESSAAAESIGGPTTAGTVLGGLIPYVELFGFALLLLAVVVGGLYMLRWEDAPALASTHLLAGGALFGITFGLSLFGVRALLPGRWLAFLYVPMALIGAVGLHYVSRTGSRRVVLAVFVLVALGYPTTMVVAEKATLDSPAFADQHKRFAYTEAEIAAVDSISEARPPAATGGIATDHPYVSLFRRVGGYGYGASVVELGPDGPAATDAAVYRSYQSSGPVTFHSAEGSAQTELPADVEGAVCPDGWNSAYANDEVRLCTARAGTGTGVGSS